MAKCCIDCGKSIPEYMKYCPKCGKIRGIEVNLIKKNTEEVPKEEPSGRCNLFTAYIRMFKKFHTTKGRSRRSEYWYVYVVDLIFVILFTTFMRNAIYSTYRTEEFLPGYYATVPTDETWAILIFFGIISMIYFFTIKWAIICLTVRRLHDVGKKGWWYILSLSIVGEIILAVFLAKDSQVGRNMYGEDPKAKERAVTYIKKEEPRVLNKKTEEKVIEIIRPQIIKKENNE